MNSNDNVIEHDVIESSCNYNSWSNLVVIPCNSVFSIQKLVTISIFA